MRYNKLCDLEDFTDDELVSVMREVCAYKEVGLPGFPKDAEHRKDWEVAMAVRAFRDLGVLRPDSVVLGVAAGMEDTVFYLTRHVRQVFATDRYVSAGEWVPTAPVSMIVDPSLVAPDDFDPNRLVVQHMDARSLRYPDDFFDGVFSSSSIEHVGEMADVANAAYEMGRVLKPGGILSLSTELRLSGPPDGMGWPGQTLVFSPENLTRYVIEASGLDLVDELDLRVSARSRSLGMRDLAYVVHDRADRAAAGDPLPEYARWDFPHTVLRHLGYEFTSVHLALRKPEHPRIDNRWAAPSAATLAAVRDWDRSLLSPPEPAPAARAAATEPEIPDPPAWDAASADPVYRRLGRRAQLSRKVAELDGLCAEADEALAQAVVVQERWRPILAGLTAERAAVIPSTFPTPATRAGWASLPLVGPGGRAYTMVVDPQAADPLAAGLAAGAAFDQSLIELMLKIVQPGDAVVDIGAHLGQFSLPAAAAGCRVLAVEASPLNAALLRASAAANGFSALRVVQAATSDHAGTLRFLPDGPFGHVAVGEAGAGPTVDVAAVTMDEIVKEFGLGSVAFVKIDVEGSELPTLAGMAGVLGGPNGPPLLVESNGHTLAKFGATPRDLLGRLEELGYTAYIVDGHRLVEVGADDFQPQTIVDYFACKRLPQAIARMEVRPALTLDEQVARVVADAGLQNHDHRAYIAAALAGAGRELLAQRAIATTLDALADDPVEGVRSAAAWWRDKGLGGTKTSRDEGQR
jgi:FkbM family methyltransferase